jgi:uncharacterized protein (TIGR02145 family)
MQSINETGANNILNLGKNSHLDKTKKITGPPYKLTNWYGYGLVPVPFTTCRAAFVVAHTVANGAPVAKTVSYSTDSSTLGGTGSKCWITQNLGADHRATSATDTTDASAGWYWQFNLAKGYTNNGTLAYPAWITNISDNNNWLAANDPCALQLGSDWRLPTQTEYQNALNAWGAADYETTWGSLLKLHAAGYLSSSDGTLIYRGIYGDYWSSLQYDSYYGYDHGWNLSFGSGSGSMVNYSKADGFPVRCLKDPPF